MNDITLGKIKEACEKVEKDSGFGVVTLKFRNGALYGLEATCSYLNCLLDESHYENFVNGLDKKQ